MKKSTVRRVINRILGMLARFAPGATSLRPFLHKLRGVRITGRVFIGDDVYVENEYPDCIELRDGAQICLRSILIAHTRGSGRIVIGKDAFVGANCVLTASPGATLSGWRGRGHCGFLGHHLGYSGSHARRQRESQAPRPSDGSLHDGDYL